MSDAPPILLIHADQHRFDTVACHGHPLVQTPNLDRLAAEGADFTHAFTPHPVCSPARACLMTGIWSSVHKCITPPGTEAFQRADPALPIFTDLLAERGYRIANVGKYGQEVAGIPTDHGAETFLPYYDYRKWRAEQGLLPEPRTNGWFGEIDPHITPEQSPLAWQCDRTLELLEDFAATYRSEERPFLLRWDPPEPHLPNIIPASLADLYPPENISPWPGFPDPLTGKPPVQKRTRQRWGTDEWTWEQWQPIVSRYMAIITLLDVQVGRLLEALDRLGLADETLVVYTCDHGDMCGAHGMMDKHFVAYEDIMRVPFFLRWPGRIAPGTVCDVFVSSEIDLARTLLSAAGIDAPSSFVGRDLVAEANGTTEIPPRPDIFAQYMGTYQALYSLRMLRNRRYKYIFHPAAFDELYDLETDPGEMTNLVEDPVHAETLHQMRIRMAEWMTGINDPLSPPLYLWR
jgi:arylsulfatase A-like enzyme